MSEEIPKSEITSVKVVRGDERARSYLDKGWILIGEATYVDSGDGTGIYHFPLGWPSSRGDTPTIYPD